MIGSLPSLSSLPNFIHFAVNRDFPIASRSKPFLFGESKGATPYYPIPVSGTTEIDNFLRWPPTSLGKVKGNNKP